jgi:hypothetical protein
MHPHRPCPLIPLQASRRRSLLALILLNWVFRALLPIVVFCVPRHPRIASWIAQRLISLTNPR